MANVELFELFETDQNALNAGVGEELVSRCHGTTASDSQKCGP